VKAMRTQKDDSATMHLSNSKEMFLRLLEISRSVDDNFITSCSDKRDYEELEIYILRALLPDKRI
jgi:xylose isomerase